MPRGGTFWSLARLVWCVAVVALLAGWAVDTTSQSATPLKNGTVIVANTADVGSILDTRLVGTTPGISLMIELYDGLVEKNWYDPTKPFEIIPGLATGWSVSKDKLTYTFKIRKGVKFHDGTRLDANAVQFNYRTFLDKSFKYYYPRANASSLRETKYIDSTKAVNRWTFQIKLKQPFYPLLDVISGSGATWIVSPAAIQKYGNAKIVQHPVGTGPFKFVSYQAGRALTLTRNDSYWRGPAAFKTLILKPISDPVVRATALQAGEVQVAEDISTKYRAAWAGRKDVKVIIRPRPRVYTCFLNYQGDRPAKNKLFRQALSLATNRGAMNAIAYDNLSTAAKGFYTPGSPQYAPKRAVLPYDAKKAAQLIDAGGWKGTKLTFQVAPGLGDPAVWDLWGQNLRAVGLSMSVKTVDVTTWVGDFVRGFTATSDIDGQCVAAGSDGFWTYAHFASKEGFPVNGGYNPGKYTNPAVEAALTRAKNVTTFAAYVAALRAADAAVAADYGLIFMIGDLNVEGVSSKVQWVPTKTQQHSFYSAKVLR